MEHSDFTSKGIHSMPGGFLFVLPIHQTYGHHPIQSKYLKKQA